MCCEWWLIAGLLGDSSGGTPEGGCDAVINSNAGTGMTGTSGGTCGRKCHRPMPSFLKERGDGLGQETVVSEWASEERRGARSNDILMKSVMLLF
jgi:hypothetical protein